jgi:hypothetical protein
MWHSKGGRGSKLCHKDSFYFLTNCIDCFLKQRVLLCSKIMVSKDPFLRVQLRTQSKLDFKISYSKKKMSHSERGSEKCKKSVTYYLNDPLNNISYFLNDCRISNITKRSVCCIKHHQIKESQVKQ